MTNLVKKGSYHKRNNMLLKSRFFLFKSGTLLIREAKQVMVELLPLKAYPLTLITVISVGVPIFRTICITKIGSYNSRSACLHFIGRKTYCKEIILFVDKMVLFIIMTNLIFVSPAKQKRDICTAFPASSLSSSLSSSAA